MSRDVRVVERRVSVTGPVEFYTCVCGTVSTPQPVIPPPGGFAPADLTNWGSWHLFDSVGARGAYTLCPDCARKIQNHVERLGAQASDGVAA